jgi:hypothetical protein
VVLEFEGDADQALLGGGEQQGADGGVERAVGDIEQPGAGGVVGEPGVQTVGDLRGGARVQFGVRHPSSSVRARRSLPRRDLTPSAAARRAASAVPPVTAAISL